MAEASSEILRKYEEQSRAGDAMETLMRSKDFEFFVKEILEPMEVKAFEDFKTLDPEDHVSVMEAQMVGKVIVKIRQAMSNMVQVGKAAKAAISDYSTQEDE